MKLKILSLLLGVGLFSTFSHASLLDVKQKNDLQSNNLSSINSVYDLLQYQDKAKRNQDLLLNTLQQEARYKQIKDYAYTLAIKTAIQSQLARANADIELMSRELDTIYNFEPLMIQGRVIPPVITLAKDLYNQETPHQIRLSGALYDIYQQAKFSSTAPNWRDYLTFPTDRNAYELIAFGATGLEPKTNYEKQLWVKATTDGWEQGINQANNIILNAMDRLNRDYIGMVRFHQFVSQNKITMPIINSYQLYDTNMGERLILDEQLLQIEKLPVFQTPNNQLNVAMTKEIAKEYGYDENIPLSELQVLTNEHNDIEVGDLLKDLTNKDKRPLTNFEPENPLPKSKIDEPLTVEITRTFIIKEMDEQPNPNVTDYSVEQIKTDVAGSVDSKEVFDEQLQQQLDQYNAPQ